VPSKRRERELARQRYLRRQQEVARRRARQRRRNAVVASVVAVLLVLVGAAYGISLLAGGGSGKNTLASPTPTVTPTPSIATPPALRTKPVVKAPKGKPPTKLVTADLIKGTGAVAKAGDKLTVNYVGLLYSNGTEFDSSWKRNQPFPVTIGQGAVIKGWDQGIPGMKVGGRRELTIPPALGYGAAGSPPTIPKNATLIFVVDLLKIG
jgi:hypothetical protein